MAYQHILFERRGAVAWITINHPERYNSFDENTIREVADAVERAGSDAGIGVIVLTGAGDKAFCAGGYLADLTNMTAEKGRRLFSSSLGAMNAIRRAPKPVIAAVNGFAVGGGNELVVACDLAIAAEHARFGQTGPRIGSSPVFGGTNVLAMSIGEKRAKEVCFLCRQFTAREALELGWINRVVVSEDLVKEVESWCEELLDKSPAYLELTKTSSNVWWDMMQPFFHHAEQTLLRLAGGPEMTEGATAFMEKRRPDFRRFRSS